MVNAAEMIVPSYPCLIGFGGDGASALQRSCSIWWLRALPAEDILELAAGWPVGQGQKTMTTGCGREHLQCEWVCLPSGPDIWQNCAGLWQKALSSWGVLFLGAWLTDWTRPVLLPCYHSAKLMCCPCRRCPHVQAAATMASNSCNTWQYVIKLTKYKVQWESSESIKKCQCGVKYKGMNW